MLKRNLKHAPQRTKALAYKTITRPLLEYSSSVWDPHTACLKNKIEFIQRRAARFVSNNYHRNPLDPSSSVTRMLNQLGWASLEQRRSDARLLLFYKAVHGLIAIPISSYLDPAGASQKITRHSHPYKFQIPHTRTNLYRYSFFPQTVSAWNNLPLAVVSASSPEAFRAQLQLVPKPSTP